MSGFRSRGTNTVTESVAHQSGRTSTVEVVELRLWPNRAACFPTTRIPDMSPIQERIDSAVGTWPETYVRSVCARESVWMLTKDSDPLLGDFERRFWVEFVRN